MKNLLSTTCELKKSESIPKYIKNQTKIRLKYNFDKHNFNNEKNTQQW